MVAVTDARSRAISACALSDVRPGCREPGRTRSHQATHTPIAPTRQVNATRVRRSYETETISGIEQEGLASHLGTSTPISLLKPRTEERAMAHTPGRVTASKQ